MLLALVALLAAACGRGDRAGTVTFWAMGKEAEVVAELVRDFEREHPGIAVDLQAIPMTAAHEKLLTAFAAEALPDVIQLGNTWLPEMAEIGALEPLEPRIATSRTVDPADYFPGIWETATYEGRVMGVPWYVDTRLLYYRKDILRDAGVTAVPRTWAEFEAAMAAVKRHVGPDRYAILLPLNEFEQQLSFGLQQPEPLLRDDDGRGNFSGPGFQRAAAFYANMFEKGWAPKMSETQISNVWDEFFNGFYAFYLSGPWNIREFRNRQPEALAGEWGTMALPGPDGPGAGIAGGSSLVIAKRSPNKDAAWQLVEYLSRPDVQQRFHALIGNLPPRRSSWDSDALRGDAFAGAFRDQLERVKPAPKVLEWERIVQEMRLATERIVRGGVPQDRALRDLDAKVDAILEKRRWMAERDREAGVGDSAPAADGDVAPTATGTAP